MREGCHSTIIEVKAGEIMPKYTERETTNDQRKDSNLMWHILPKLYGEPLPRMSSVHCSWCSHEVVQDTATLLLREEVS